MAIFVFVLGLCFAVMGALSLFLGYDLGGTERGVAYTISGSVALAAAGLLFGIGTVTARLSTLINLLGARPAPEAPLPSVDAAPAYTETPRPAMPFPRQEPAEAADLNPVPPAAPKPLAPVLAGGAAAVATAAVLSHALGKDTTEKAPPAEPVPAPAADPGFNFEAALAEELARTGPEAAPPPPRSDLPVLERAEPRLGDSFWDLREEPAKPAETVAFVEPPAEHEVDAAHAFAEPMRETKPEPEDWLTAPATGLRADEDKAPDHDLPEDVFDDRFVDEPRDHADEPASEAPPHHDESAAPFDVETHEPEHAEPARADSSVLHSPEPEHEPEAPHAITEPPRLPPAAAPDDPGRKVIGSYSVGTNNYTMYADGSVEAHTETGLYRFASLDELRHFIEKGATLATTGEQT